MFGWNVAEYMFYNLKQYSAFYHKKEEKVILHEDNQNFQIGIK